MAYKFAKYLPIIKTFSLLGGIEISNKTAEKIVHELQ